MAVLTDPYEISIWERTSELKEVGDGFYKKYRKKFDTIFFVSNLCFSYVLVEQF